MGSLYNNFYDHRIGVYHTIKNKFKFIALGLLSALFLFLATALVNADHNPTIEFTTSEQTIGINEVSSIITAELSNASGSGNTDLYASVNDGELSLNGLSGWSNEVSKTINNGGAINLYYRNHTSGTFTINASSQRIHPQHGWNISVTQNINVEQAVIVDTEAPVTPDHISPSNNAFRTTATQTLIDWTEVIDHSSPVTYRYESSHSSDTNPDGSFVSPVYTSGVLSSSEIPTPGTPEGVYYWHIKAIDNAGNESDWSNAWKITVDNTKPATNWDSTEPVVTNNPTLSGNSTDNLAGVDMVELQIIEDGSGDIKQDWTITNVVPSDGTFDSTNEDFSASPTTSLPDGTYIFKARATDKAGNVENTAVIEVTIDTAAPGKPVWNGFFKGHNSNVANFIPCGGFTNTTQVRFDWNDNTESDVAYYWFGTQFNSKHKKVTSPTYYNGNMTPGNNPYYYTVIAVDEAGNESVISDQCGLILDQVAPVVTVTPLSGDGILHGTVTFDITVTDDNLDPSILNNIWTYLYNSAPPQKQKGAGVDLSSGHGTFTVNTKLLDDGSAILDVGKLYDAAGNPSGTGDNYFSGYTIDNTASDGIFIFPTSLDITNDEVTVEVEIDDPSGLGSQQIVMRDTGGAVAGNWSYNVKTGASNTIAGPAGIFNYTGDDFSGNLKITFNTNDLPSDGQYNLRLFTKDALGNGRSNIYASMIVDNTPPETTWDDGDDITTSEPNPTFTGNATDSLSGVASVELRIEDGSATPVQDWTSTNITANDGAFGGTSEGFSASPESPLGDGTYTFFARAIDVAGNIESTAIMTVTVNTTPSQSSSPNSSSSSNSNSNNGNTTTANFGTASFSTFGTFGTTNPADDGNVLSADDNNSNNENGNDGDVQADASGVSSATAEDAKKSGWSLWWILPIIAAFLLMFALWRRRSAEEEN